MIKAEEKASWILEFAWNQDYNNRQYNDIDTLFDYGDWILICSMTGGYLAHKSILIGWVQYSKTVRIFSFLTKLPDSKEEFDSLVKEIKAKGKKSLCEFPSLSSNIYYYNFYHQKKLGADIATILRTFNFRSELSELERFKIAIKRVYKKEFINEIIKIIMTTIKIFLFFLLISTLGIFLGMNFDSFLGFNYCNFTISVILFIFLIFILLQQKKNGFKILKKIDDLGIEFFNLTDYERSNFLYYNIVTFGDADHLSVLNKIKKEIEELKGFNFIN